MPNEELVFISRPEITNGSMKLPVPLIPISEVKFSPLPVSVM